MLSSFVSSGVDLSHILDLLALISSFIFTAWLVYRSIQCRIDRLEARQSKEFTRIEGRINDLTNTSVTREELRAMTESITSRLDNIYEQLANHKDK